MKIFTTVRIKPLPALFLMLLLAFSCSNPQQEITLTAGDLKITLDGRGFLTGFYEVATGKNYLAKDTLAPMLSLRLNGRYLFPVKVEFDSKNNRLTLHYDENTRAVIKVETKPTHLAFELLSVTDAGKFDLAVWGPYPLTLNKYIGETVGIAGNDEFTAGIQSLNPKTLGGYPWSENDCMPQIDIFDQDDLSDMSEKGKRYVLYRVEAAKPAGFGSTLQAYCRNRNKPRIIKNLNYDKYVAPPFNDGGITGSKIALFGCPPEQTLTTIGAIEVAEGLPHPMLDGQWAKTAKGASAAYLIMDFGEKDIDKALAVTKKAGLRYLYHPGPFETWGHFVLNKKQFPGGIGSMRRCVEKAKRQGIMLGVHTLSNFITTNDAYVTPVPDRRLAGVGSSVLPQDVDAQQTEIFIDDPEFFRQYKNSNLKTAMLGEELILYGGVSPQPPWKLTDCRRGAWGTKAVAHKKGDTVSMLADHGYKVFLTNAELGMEVAENIANLFNETGLRQISFDGLEGNRSTGMGNYGEILFTTSWFNRLDKNIKMHYIADASRTSHYFWHIYTRMNWGEPWYAGFRESQTEYRLKNQEYFRRNRMPGMLGWFKMTGTTSIEDVEWMLARSAAFDAGYGFFTSYKWLDENGNTDTILQLLGEWEKARMSNAFPDTLKKLMEDVKNEFHLEPVKDNEWKLYRIYSYKYNYEKRVRQPGEPFFEEFDFSNPAGKQPLQFILTAKDGTVSNVSMEIDDYREIRIPVKLKAGETLKYRGGNEAKVYDKTWHLKRTVPVDEKIMEINNGDHTLTFECNFSGGEKPVAGLELRLVGETWTISGK